jgi:hypothetical protein
MDDFSVKLDGERELGFMFDTLLIAAPDKVNAAIAKSALSIESEAKKNCPVGITGGLRQGIHADLMPEEFRAQVAAHSPGFGDTTLAECVEFGTRPHMPPVQALVPWVEVKLNPESDTSGGDNEDEVLAAAWALAMKIKAEGTPAQPFMFPAAEAEKLRYVQNLKDEFKDLLR